jgi:hypothetical protein
MSRVEKEIMHCDICKEDTSILKKVLESTFEN